jgi:NADH-quinone oxidoreductase subunit I
MCEEACPVDAIELTSFYDLTGLSREEMIFDKTKLLSVYDLTKKAEPMKSGIVAPDTDRTNELYTTPTTGPVIERQKLV